MASEARAPIECDVLIVGGGIAGASLGAELAGQSQVVLIDAESHCGYHSTGRSAAFWLESYGGPVVAVLSKASHQFLADGGFLSPRGAIHVSREAVTQVPGVSGLPIDRAELERLLPGVQAPWRSALLEESCADIDVAGLHGSYLAAFRRGGGRVLNDARLVRAKRENDGWVAELENGAIVNAKSLVDAAGAWADDVARCCGVQPLGIRPKRRTMAQLRVGRSELKQLPLVIDAKESFYFKGEGDRTIWLSPHDEIDSNACDAAPEEIDVATAIDRFEHVVDWPIEAVERSWAGLRSFAPDRVPVYGWDPEVPSFFWCAGQGGFGIQTAPAASRLTAALLLGQDPHPSVGHIDPSPFAPERFSRS